MSWTATAHTIDRPAWMRHAMMCSLHVAKGDMEKAECEVLNLMGSLAGERSRVQA